MSHGRERPIARLQRMLLMFSLEGRVDWELIIAKTRSNTCYSTPHGPENEKKKQNKGLRGQLSLYAHMLITKCGVTQHLHKKKKGQPLHHPAPNEAAKLSKPLGGSEVRDKGSGISFLTDRGSKLLLCSLILR